MREITSKIYSFNELSDSIKSKLVDENRLTYVEEPDGVLEDFRTVCETLGIEIRERHGEDMVYYSGFWSQGDGASFFGTYKPVPDSAAAIKEYAPIDEKLHDIAKQLDDVQAAWGKPFTANITEMGNHYSHSSTMSVDFEPDDDCELEYDDYAVHDKALQSALRELADWLYRQLEEDYNYHTTVEYVTEQLVEDCSEYYEDGTVYKGE